MERVLYGMKQTVYVSSRVGWPALSDLIMQKLLFLRFFVSLFLVFFLVLSFLSVSQGHVVKSDMY